ncbi:glucose 1-dehydrogenase [Paenibacillus sp. UNC496MF]|uniref:SDR family NAD(P)-dependent oxidoreductase n=1 Tax=Paenibacillus sp. UNC496MF TaxID=1502753 RepID=UPI0008EA8968|nr:SDR family oxidoreductase [Paenibacillus sp. UNC496MF]SFJ69833.1 glucose 1-dehydrogenase [Paenibacillus sp. UNC496MF]
MGQSERKRTALVTGASMGIGRGVALLLASRGYDLAIGHYAEPAEAEETAERIRREYGRACHVFQGDLAEPDMPARLAAFAEEMLAGIDVLVNNAGLVRFKPITELDPAEMDRVYAINFRAPMVLMHAVAKGMTARGARGAIVNVTSSRAERAYPGDAVYGGLKAALTRASQSVALDLAPRGIRVNCVAPGATAVRDDPRWEPGYAELGGKIPLGRMGRPADVAEAVAWLASEEAGYVTGAAIRVDGGLILPGMPERGGSPGWNA